MIDKQTNTRLKHFAQDARRYLIDQVNTKLREVLTSDSDASTYEKTKPLYNAFLKEVLNGLEHSIFEVDHGSIHLGRLGIISLVRAWTYSIECYMT